MSRWSLYPLKTKPYVKRRIGLIGAVDLEKYEYSQKSSALVRSTEGTIEERIPPRLKIRENAHAEFSHIMVLFDDERREINETLYLNRDKYRKLYDFNLNMGGGSVQGYFIDDVESVLNAFSGLLEEKRLITKYGKADCFAFAVGDGNHSLATAKAHWDKLKKTLTEKERVNHPARFALAEFVNIYDDGIYFEPIFRFVSGINKDKFVAGLKSVAIHYMGVYADGKTEFFGEKGNIPGAIKTVDSYIKSFISENGGTVDYIHGEENLHKLVDHNVNSVGILFDRIDKSELFKYVSERGAFPRKTFSMGEGVEKRYYLEGKRI